MLSVICALFAQERQHPTPSATVQQLVSPVNCDVIPHLDWFDRGPSCVVNVVEKQCFYTRCFYFCLCVMSHAATVLASSLDLLQHTIFFFFPTGRSTRFELHRFTLLSWHLSPPPPHSSAALKETCDTIFCHYSSNIYTTLSKLHLAGNMFRCLSTPHGVAGGLASIKGSTAKTGRQNEESGCSW